MKQKIKKIGNSELKNYMGFSNQFYQNLLGYKPERTKLQILINPQWQTLCKRQGSNKNSHGIFLPRDQLANILAEAESTPLNLFHEYFGHGLYCEQSQVGRKLVDLEKELLKEEKEYFNGMNFTPKNLNKFREKNSIFQDLMKLRAENYLKYEGFAIWTEFLLSRKFGLEKMFQKKYKSLSQELKNNFYATLDFQNLNGTLATFYESGLARQISPQRAKILLEHIYGKKLDDVKFAILYGSRKPFGDIDIYMVGFNPQEAHTDWLDVKMKSYKEFEKGTNLFDVRVCVPLMTSEFILGDRRYFENSKKRLLQQPITKGAIKHNLKWYSRMGRLKESHSRDDFLRKKFSGYARSYLANALALQKGIRLFTEEELLNF